MFLKVFPDGVCMVAGIPYGVKVPPFVYVSKGKWFCFWDDLQRILDELPGDPTTEPESAARYKMLAQENARLMDAVHGEVEPWEPADVTLAPRSYQVRAAQAAYAAEGMLLADAVGMGKTYTAYLVRERIRDDDPKAKTIVVATCSLKRQWALELVRYGCLKRHLAVTGQTKHERAYAYQKYLKTPGAILVMNYEQMLCKEQDILKSVFQRASLVIADEASRIKNRSSKTAKQLKALAGATQWRLPMTATPVEVGAENLYSIMEWVQPGMLGTFGMFRRFYLIEKAIKLRRGPTIHKVVGYKNINHLSRRIHCRVLRRRPEDVGEEMPGVVPAVEWVEMKPAQKRVYDQAKQGAYRAKDAPMVAVQDAVRACLTPMLFEGKGPGIKTERLVEFLTTEAAGEKALVFSESRRYIEKEIMPALKKAGVQAKKLVGGMDAGSRQMVQEYFNGGAFRVLVLTAAGEYGLNLPCGLVVDMDMTWNGARLLQRAGRARRMGSGIKTVRVINFLTRGTIEEKVLRRVLGRRTLAEALVGVSDMDVVGEKLSAEEMRKLL